MKTISYDLTRAEVKSALYLTGQLRPFFVKSIIESAIAAVIFIIYLVDVIINPSYTIGYVCMVALAIVIAAALLLPRYNEKSTVEKVYERVKNTITLTENEDGSILVNTGESEWSITSEKLLRFDENDDMIAVILKSSRFVAVPKRALGGKSGVHAFVKLLKML